MFSKNGNGRLKAKPMNSLPHEQSESLTDLLIKEVMFKASNGDEDGVRKLLEPLLPKEDNNPAPVSCEPDRPIETFRGVIGELWAMEGDPTQLRVKPTNASLRQFKIVAKKINQAMRGGKHFADRHGSTKPLDEMPLEDAVAEIRKAVLCEMRAQLHVNSAMLTADDK